MVNREIIRRLFLSDLNMSDVTVSLAEAFETARIQPTEANIRTYAIIAQAEAFTKKASDGEISEELIQKSEENFNRIEQNLKRLNACKSFESTGWIERARDLIHQVLSPLERIEDEMWSYCRFGPGVTCKASGARGRYLLEKIAGVQSCTDRALPIFLEVVSEHFPNWKETLMNTSVDLVLGNRTAHVPKDIRKCRRIAIEPSCNLFLQMGIGGWLSQRLRYFGVDISDQSYNRKLARIGSLNRSVATIDLSDASDSIARELVRSLLPRDWFYLLDSVRSRSSLDGYVYEKFSSQGNAFTFPLETLIFWAITKSVSSFCSVYGDDIICDSESYDSVLAALSEAGFTPNPEKSYSEGYFRESCGGDYIAGVNVRPVFYKETCRRASDVAKLHNLLLMRWGWNLPLVRSYLVSLASKPLFGPSAYWSTKKDEPWKNVLVYDLEGYFFSEDESLWSRRKWSSVPLKVTWFNLHVPRTRELAFIYAMRNIEDVSALRRFTTARSIERECGLPGTLVSLPD